MNRINVTAIRFIHVYAINNNNFNNGKTLFDEKSVRSVDKYIVCATNISNSQCNESEYKKNV